MSNYKELIKGSTSAFALRVLGVAVKYLFTVIITRQLGAATFGVFVLALSLLQILSSFGKMGLDLALVKLLPEYALKGMTDHVRAVYIMVLKLLVPIGLALSAAVYLLSGHISMRFFSSEGLIFYLKVISLCILPYMIIQVNSQAMRGLKDIKFYMIYQFVAIELLGLIAMAVFLPVFNDDRAVPIIYTLCVIVVMAMSTINLMSRIGGSARRAGSVMPRAQLLALALPLMTSGIIMMAMQWIDTFMLGYFEGDASVGVYNVSFRVALLISLPLFAASSISAPKFSELHGDNDMVALKSYVRQAAKISFLGAIPFFVIIAALPGPLLRIFGEGFQGGRIALLMLAASQLINAFCGPVGFYMQMTGRMAEFNKIVVGAAVLNIALNSFLIPRFSLAGAAGASLASLVFWNAACVFMVYRSSGVLLFYYPSRLVRDGS